MRNSWIYAYQISHGGCIIAREYGGASQGGIDMPNNLTFCSQAVQESYKRELYGVIAMNWKHNIFDETECLLK